VLALEARNLQGIARNLADGRMRGVTILGINAVWQKVMTLPQGLKPGSIHRTLPSASFFSGKGGNVAIAMERLGHPDIELVQALGGETGKWIEMDMARFSITSKPLWISSDSRMCTTLIEGGGRTTELIEPSPEMTSSEWRRMADLVQERLVEGRDILICGSFPGGDPAPLLECLSTRPKENRLWLDGVREDVLNLSPEVLKINRHELTGLVKQSRGLAEDCQEVSHRFHIPTLIITAEDGHVCLWKQDQWLEIPVPPVAKVVNTTGAGDTFFGALVNAHQRGLTWRNCLGSAIQWASFRCGLANIEDLPKEMS